METLPQFVLCGELKQEPLSPSCCVLEPYLGKYNIYGSQAPIEDENSGDDPRELRRPKLARQRFSICNKSVADQFDHLADCEGIELTLLRIY